METIGILLPGHIRSYDKVRINIQENLLIPLQKEGYKYKIYTSLWDNTGFRENQWGGKGIFDQIKVDADVFEIERHNRQYFIQKYNNDKWKEYSHLSGPETCGDAVSMWYKVWKSFKLLYGTPDVVIRIRPDIYFQSKFDVNWLKNIEPNTVYMANWYGKYEEINKQMMDQFAFGDYKSMDTYCSIYPNIGEIIKRNDSAFTGEGFLYSHLSHNNMTVKRRPIRYGLMRINKVDDIAK